MLERPTALLNVRGLARSASDGKQLLHPVSFAIHSGDRIVCKGSSGSGKTVLLRSIAKLDAVQGEVLWHGDPIEDQRVPIFRSQVMYLPQRPQLPEGTVREALMEPFAWQVHHPKRFSEDKALAYLQSLSKPSSMIDSRTRDLSEGESQVVALVRVMLLSPTVLLLDEPTSALDAESTLTFENVVLSWLGEAKRAIMWVTHLNEQAKRIATRRFQVKDGSVAVDV